MTVASDTDAFAFMTRLHRLTTPLECGALFKAAIMPFGFDTFACGELDLGDRERTVFYIIDWPDRWTRFYQQSGLINRDPLIDGVGERRQPFTWSDLRAEGKLARVGRQALDLAAAEGWIEGFVVPFRTSGRRVGLVSMVGNQLIAEEARAFISLISLTLHTHVRTLAAREGFALPPAGLTAREIQCIRLVAQGVADKAIAATLGIAASTAHEFVEKAKRKLKAKSRAELIAVSVALGIVDI